MLEQEIRGSGGRRDRLKGEDLQQQATKGRRRIYKIKDNSAQLFCTAL